VGNRQVVQGVRTGGRSARVREAILAATFRELIDSGYAAMSVEAVAARAGVNKTTIYRRWPTLDDLVTRSPPGPGHRQHRNRPARARQATG
jgi:DNA-binding transcriptional regulator YbjK